MGNELGRLATDEELSAMIAAFDVTNSGGVNFRQFVAEVLKDDDDEESQEDQKTVDEASFKFTEETLVETFRAMDVDGDGFITFFDLKAVVQSHLEEELSDDELTAMIFTVDPLRDPKKISFDSFCRVMGVK